MKTLTRAATASESDSDSEESRSRDRTATTESRAPELPLTGSVLLGRFAVGERLGAGGMGVVYEAVDRHIGAPVALKFLHRAGARALYRLKHEFRVMSALGPHPNLITPSGLFCEQGRWFVSMELVRGEPLLNYMRPGGKLDLQRTREALAQLARGLAAMHREGKVHRDLKPSNVLVTAEDRVVILDFGLVSDHDVDADAAIRGKLSGTPRYMAPEQARGEPATCASDFYAVGVMLYEALTGISPFECDSLDTLDAKQEREPLLPLVLAPQLPADLSQLCMRLLARAPSDRPDAGAVLAALGHGPAAVTPAAQSTPRAHWVGREAELAALRAALRRTDEGRPQLVLIEGESAVGKSALVEAFVATLPAGTVALTSRCHARADVPFKACDELVDELGRFLSQTPSEDAQRWAPQDLDALLQMFPVLGRVPTLVAAPRRAQRHDDEQELRRRGAAALRELLGRIAAEQPLVLFIDDLQWGDIDSATLLRELLRAPAAPPLLFLGAHRVQSRDSSEFIRAVRALAGEAGIELQTLPLAPLPPPEAERLAQDLLGDAAAPGLAATIARESSGMPLFVRELTTQAREGLLSTLPQGSVLAAAIARRVATLPKPARDVLELVAIALAPLPEALVLEAAELGAGAPAAVRLLDAQALLRVRSDGRLDTYHDRVRESVSEQIEDERRRTLHTSLARALVRSSGTPPDWLAAHALAAGLTDIGLRATLEAADEAMRKLAFERAASHYRVALDLVPPGDARRGDVLVRLADACRLDGRGREAGDLYVAAAESADRESRTEYLRRASELYLCNCYVDLGIDAMSIVLRDLGLSFPRRRWGLLLALLRESLAVAWHRRRFRERDEASVARLALARIDACYSVGLGLLNVAENMHESALYLLRGLRLALQAGAARRAAYVQCVIASMPPDMKALDQSMEAVFEPNLSIARTHDDRELEAWTHVCTAMAHLYVVRGSAAVAYGTLARETCDAAGIFEGFTRTSAEHTLRIGLMLCGRMSDLAEIASEHAHRARERSNLFAWTAARVYRAVATLAADQPEEALAELSAAYDSWSEGEHWRRWRNKAGIWPNAVHALFIQTWTLVYRGDGPLAFETIRSRWGDVYRQRYLKYPGWRTLLSWVRAAAAVCAASQTGARAPLRDARRLSLVLRRTKLDAARSFASLLEASLAALDGDDAAARAHLRAAAEAFDGLEMQLFAASARRKLAELDQSEDGPRRLEEQDALMRALGVVSPERWTAMYVPGFERLTRSRTSP